MSGAPAKPRRALSSLRVGQRACTLSGYLIYYVSANVLTAGLLRTALAHGALAPLADRLAAATGACAASSGPPAHSACIPKGPS
jgi:hypothetical protein